MPKVVRFQDLCTGHDGYQPRPNIEASPSVFGNDLGLHRVGDEWDIHCRKSCHGGEMLDGSPNVFINDRALARVGDRITCGSYTRDGSPNIFCND